MIYYYVVTGVIMLLSLLIQGHTSFDVLKFSGTKPDLLFIAIVYFGYSFGSFYGQTTAFIGGLFHDAISNLPLGLLTLPKVAVGYIMGMFGRDVIQSNVLTVLIIVFCASIVKGVITLLLALIFNEASIMMIKDVILPESFYNAILAVILFPLFDKIFSVDKSDGGYR